jgi:hypothetical protein
MPSRKKTKNRPTDLKDLFGPQWWQVLLWSRLRLECLSSAASCRLFRDLILENFVSLSISGPHSLRDKVERIATDAHKPIPIDYLCWELGDRLLSGASAVFGCPGENFNRIARNFPELYWCLSDKGLRMEILGKNDGPVSFDALAGHLLSQARSSRGPKRLLLTDYLVIAEELDKAGFRLLDQLQGQYRRNLAVWNQKHPNNAIKTFREAIGAKQPSELWRGVRRRLYYAEEKIRNGTA